MKGIVFGVLAAVAGAVILARKRKDIRASAEELAAVDRWEEEGGSPPGQPQQTPVSEDAVQDLVATAR